MKTFRTVGVIVNPVAGKMELWGKRVWKGLGSLVGRVDSLLAGPQHLGEEWARRWGFRFVVAGSAVKGTREDTLATATGMAEKKADLIVAVGGDGTLRDVASALYKAGAKTPILGVGVGSTNVGPLITLRGDAEWDGLDLEQATPKPLDGFWIKFDGETEVSLHDVYISTFLVGSC